MSSIPVVFCFCLAAQAGAADESRDDPGAAGGAAHWALRPIVAHRPPGVDHGGRVRQPVDSFIVRRLAASGLSLAPETDRRTLIRRVSFDLIGLPPAPDDVREFVSDGAPDAYERVVDRLLASPHYGERWGRHWLDLVRFAETAGNEFDYEIPFAWRYRDYVIRALNQDLPYDRFVIEHLAGDLLDPPRRHPVEGFDESAIGTGFFWLGQAMQSPIDVLEEECETIENQLDVAGKTFLGLTVACARCHDHKFDPISMRDYYALTGYLQSSRRQFAFIDPPGETLEVIRRLEALDAERGHVLVEAVQDRLASRAAALVDALLEARGKPLPERVAGLLETAAQDPLDLLHPWAALAAVEGEESVETRRRELVRAHRAGSEGADRPPTVTAFEDFDGDSYGRWRATGHAFGSGPSCDIEVVPGGDGESPIAGLVPPGHAYSGRVSGRLRGVLRSPTFTIERRFIHYRARRFAGDPPVPKIDPGELKAGQIHLIVDGFHMIRQPIYNVLSIDVAADGRSAWYSQDAGKWVGHRAYIEIADEDNGSIAVDRIVFSDDGSFVETPNPLIRGVVERSDVSSPESLARGYRAVFDDSVALWRRGALASSPDRDARVEVINWLLRRGAEFAVAGGVGASAVSATGAPDEHVAERLALASRIAEPRRALAMLDGTPEEARVLVRGDHETPGELSPRRFLAALGGGGPPDARAGSGRLALAGRIAGRSNPLTPRVAVNRIWQRHFGRGIVPTPDDFGAMGRPPTHPELLDFLAAELVHGGWSIKRMIRSITTSSAYRMSSTIDPAAERVDPGNRWLHRMPVRRLEGEIIRDAILSVSGRLDLRMEGPSVLPHLTRFMEGRGRPEESGPLDGDGRRSIYISVRRNFLTPMFLVFDYPPPQSTIGRRVVSNVPAQALTLWNNPFVAEQARLWAERALRDVGEAPRAEARVRRLYETAFARPPSESELAAAAEFLEEHGREYDGPDDPRAWADLCHVIINVREFTFIR